MATKAMNYSMKVIEIVNTGVASSFMCVVCMCGCGCMCMRVCVCVYV